jgi:hypothetical protein
MDERPAADIAAPTERESAGSPTALGDSAALGDPTGSGDAATTGAAAGPAGASSAGSVTAPGLSTASVNAVGSGVASSAGARTARSTATGDGDGGANTGAGEGLATGVPTTARPSGVVRRPSCASATGEASAAVTTTAANTSVDSSGSRRTELPASVSGVRARWSIRCRPSASSRARRHERAGGCSVFNDGSSTVRHWGNDGWTYGGYGSRRAVYRTRCREPPDLVSTAPAMRTHEQGVYRQVLRPPGQAHAVVDC